MPVKFDRDQLLKERTRWQACQTDMVWGVKNELGTVIATGLTEYGAVLIAAAPALLRFVAGFYMTPNAPARLDIDRVLSLAGIEITTGTKTNG